MRRFQDALKGHLSKQLQKAELEVLELKEALRGKLTEREELGVNTAHVHAGDWRFGKM